MNAIKFIVSLQAGWQQEKLIPKHLPRNVVVVVAVAAVFVNVVAAAVDDEVRTALLWVSVQSHVALVGCSCCRMKSFYC